MGYHILTTSSRHCGATRPGYVCNVFTIREQTSFQVLGCAHHIHCLFVPKLSKYLVNKALFQRSEFSNAVWRTRSTRPLLLLRSPTFQAETRIVFHASYSCLDRRATRPQLTRSIYQRYLSSIRSYEYQAFNIQHPFSPSTPGMS